MAKSLEELRSKGILQPEKSSKKEPETPKEILVSWIKTILGAIVIVMFVNGALVASFVVPTGSMENTVLTGDFLFVNKFIFGPTTPQLIPFFNTPLPFFKFPGIRNPKKGDVIVFIFPGNREEVESPEFTYYLKRCVAVSGDTLLVKNKVVFVNGVEQPLAPAAHYDSHIPISSDDNQRTFPPGRGFSRDNYGPLVIPKKGDVVQLSSANFQEWEMFIRREGHKVGYRDGQMLIDGAPSQTYNVKKDYCFGMGDNRDNSLDSRYWGFVPMENVVGTPLITYWSWDTNADNFSRKFKTIRFNRVGKIIR